MRAVRSKAVASTLFLLALIVLSYNATSTEQDGNTQDHILRRNNNKTIEQHRSLQADSKKDRYTTFQCIGASQALETKSMKQASVTVFPLNDPAHRTCLFKNICAVKGQLTYYLQDENPSIPKEYVPEGFGGNVFHVGYLRAFTLPISTTIGPVPSDYEYSPIELTFLDANSWSFNYGHYLIDNVLPAFMAAKLFNLKFTGTQQLFETSCRLFSILEPAFADRIISYNHSMGSHRQGCLTRLNGMYHHFFDNPPLYLDDYADKNICYKKLMVGQGSTFGLKSIDLSRALFLRDFRDFVLDRISHTMPPQEDLILVGLRTVGSAGGKIIHELCDVAKKAVKALPPHLHHYRLECFTPSDLTFEREIMEVQRAKIVISVHGTISYLSLFTRDGTQQISVANPNELKENQILLYATHFHTHYLTWDKLDQGLLPGLLHHTVLLSEAYHNGD